MKTLQDYILEQVSLNESDETKATFTFDFTDLENADEIIKGFSDKSECEVDDKKLTVTVTPDTVRNIHATLDALQQYVDKLMGSTKRSSNEQYAQKIRKFSDAVSAMKAKIDEIETPEEPEDTKEKDDKKDAE